MRVQHYLIGYDKADGSPQIEVPLPPARLAAIKRLLPRYADDPDALDPYELSPRDARHIAALVGQDVNENAYDFYLQAFQADDTAPASRASAPAS